MKPGKLAIIAGEPSGDIIAADLVRALARRRGQRLELVGVGGEALMREGLESLFDYGELSIMGFSAALAKLPKLIWRIRQTADRIVAARPDCLVIVDSPDFTHRVARRVRKALPELKIIDYVCPTVWAWKPERAPAMRAYIDHVLSVFPFEEEIMARLDGPPLTYVGHRLMSDPGLRKARAAQVARSHGPRETQQLLCLLLPGSRRGEIERLAKSFGEAAKNLLAINPAVRFVLPTSTRMEAMVRKAMADFDLPCDIVVGEERKWEAFGRADVAIAASGTVLLELALAGVAHMSSYKLDPIARMLSHKVTAWTAALPNMIAGHVVIQEFFNEQVRPERLALIADQLGRDTVYRQAMLAEFEMIRKRMRTEVDPSEKAAGVVISLLESGN